MTIRVYHRTSDFAADIVEREGFRDAFAAREGYPVGVRVSNVPYGTCNQTSRPVGGPVFMIELEGISRERMFHEFELIMAGKPDREFIIPQDLLNTFKRTRMTANEADAIAADDIWNDYPPGEPGRTWMLMEEGDDWLGDGKS